MVIEPFVPHGQDWIAGAEVPCDADLVPIMGDAGMTEQEWHAIQLGQHRVWSIEGGTVVDMYLAD